MPKKNDSKTPEWHRYVNEFINTRINVNLRLRNSSNTTKIAPAGYLVIIKLIEKYTLAMTSITESIVEDNSSSLNSKIIAELSKSSSDDNKFIEYISNAVESVQYPCEGDDIEEYLLIYVSSLIQSEEICQYVVEKIILFMIRLSRIISCHVDGGKKTIDALFIHILLQVMDNSQSDIAILQI